MCSECSDPKHAPAAGGYFPHTRPRVSFAELEEEILKYWKQDGTFQRSIRQREDKGAPDYVFYDGPPFATGLPHYGHILTSYIKDTVPRYFTMRGRTVDRRWGWDCHGLPIENEIEKELGITGKQQIEEFGIAKFNDRCREVVVRYTREWEEIITRLGRWVDFQRDYKTMDLSYMESVLCIFGRLFKKGLIYEGEKVVAYCYRCQTPLSNFEARLDDSFRPRQDPSVTVRFRRLPREGETEDKPTFFLAWTTTPWTLPSNVALAVGPEIEYVKINMPDGDYWMAEARRSALPGEFANAPIAEKCLGAALVGDRFEPLMPFFAPLAAQGAFRVIAANFVTTEDGVGIVHIAPAFGEEDAEVGAKEGLPTPNPVDVRGCFTHEVPLWANENVHEANKHILRWLKDHGRLIHQQTLDHNYPHCWRCDNPLIYKAIPTWYLRVTEIKDKMIAANKKINWVPSHIRDGRFGDWLEGARDWAISRSRYWGAPIPVWRCDKTDQLFVPESIAELEKLWGKPIKDLHRPAVDEIEFPSPAGGTFRRVPDVLDCWFESGAMPYAQVHYPFEHKEWFEKNFPADFIVEYIAQTRGWFYTLVVEAAALFDLPPFSNCICHGVVLAEDGRKMSKRLRNYPDPMEIVNEFGSDALRIALLASPVVRGGNLRFSRRDVEQALKDFMIPLWNSFHFFTAYANLDHWTPDAAQIAADTQSPVNRTDRYILAKLEEVKEQLVRHAETYDIVACYEAIKEFIERLNNWFIRLNRRRFWSDDDPSGKRTAYAVLHTVLRELSLAAAPFIPFTMEAIYRGLTGSGDSAHLQDWPEAVPARRNSALVREAEIVQKIVYLGRHIRERHNIKTRQPLALVQVAGVEASLLEGYREEILGELNVKKAEAITDLGSRVRRELKPDARKLGPRLGKQFKDVLAAAKAGQGVLRADGRMEAAGVVLEADEFTVEYQVLQTSAASEAGKGAGAGNEKGAGKGEKSSGKNEKGAGAKSQAAAEKSPAAAPESGCASAGDLIVLLSLHVDRGLLLEGLARDIVRATQELRKQSGLNYEDRVRLSISTESPDVNEALTEHRDWILSETLGISLEPSPLDSPKGQTTLESADAPIEIRLAKA